MYTLQLTDSHKHIQLQSVNITGMLAVPHFHLSCT